LPTFRCDGESPFCIVEFGENLGSKQVPRCFRFGFSAQRGQARDPIWSV
jgi:hypothetical protein